MLKTLASIEFSETDRRALIILLILLVIVILIIGLIGMAVRATMHFQAKRADTMMHDVAVTHVVDNPKAFRCFGFKKNNRILFRDSLKPFALALIALITWLIFNFVTNRWSESLFGTTSELFIHIKWDNDLYPASDPLWVKVFGISVLARWPETMPEYPRFVLDNLVIYIVTLLFTVSIVWYAVYCQAYLARLFRIDRLSRTIYQKSLEGFKAMSDVKINPDKPLPPSD